MTFGAFIIDRISKLSHIVKCSIRGLSNGTKVDLALLGAELHPGYIGLVLCTIFALHGFRNASELDELI